MRLWLVLAGTPFLKACPHPKMHCASPYAPGAAEVVIVSKVAPCSGPVLGDTDRTSSSGWYSYCALVRKLSCAVLPTSTVVLPGRRAGITHVTMLDVFHVPRDALDTPTRHSRCPELTNPRPITVTEVPPASGPKLGSTRSATPSRTYRNTRPSLDRSAPSLPVTSSATSPSAPAGAMQLSRLELVTSALTSMLPLRPEDACCLACRIATAMHLDDCAALHTADTRLH